MDVPVLSGRGVSCVSVMHLYSASTSIILEIQTKLLLVGEKLKKKKNKPTSNKISASPSPTTSSK